MWHNKSAIGGEGAGRGQEGASQCPGLASPGYRSSCRVPNSQAHGRVGPGQRPPVATARPGEMGMRTGQAAPAVWSLGHLEAWKLPLAQLSSPPVPT